MILNPFLIAWFSAKAINFGDTPYPLAHGARKKVVKIHEFFCSSRKTLCSTYRICTWIIDKALVVGVSDLYLP